MILLVLIQKTEKMKKTVAFLIAAILSSAAYAQCQQGSVQDAKHEVFKTFHSRAYKNQYPLREIPVAPHRASLLPAKVSAQTKAFTDRVWFPGEWEEVKAIIITPYYDCLVPGHEDDYEWHAESVVTGYGEYYHKVDGKWQIEDFGPCVARMDTTAAYGKVLFHLMDGIQQGGAEAWVRLEQEADTALVHETLSRMNLHHDRLRFFYGRGNSIWYRDCGPICFYYGEQDSLAMLDFIYSRHSRAHDDSIPSLLHRQMGIPNYMTKVLWEGGNCLVDGAGAVISSDAVYTINQDTLGAVVWDGQNISSLHHEYKPALTPDEVKQALHEMLGQRATHIIPRYLFDGSTGHVDLYADAYDENGFVFSVMPDAYSSWTDYTTGHNNIDLLCRQKSIFDRNYYDMAHLPFPSKEEGEPFADEEEYDASYSRTYSNHCFVNNVILQPCFSEVGADGMPTEAWDRANIEAVKAAYPGYTVYCIDVSSFDAEGGALHCVTKQIPADNPIRILHKNIHGSINLGELTAIPVSAVITNRSGISHAEVVWRTDQGDWQTITLTANGNRFYGSLPISLTDVPHTVEYYISATSCNGKTITKPFTASQGGYFTFTYNDGNPEFDSTMFDFDTEPMPTERITFPFGSNWLTEDTTEDDPTTTGIVNLDISHRSDNRWATLQGIMLSSQPTKPGVFIHYGKKVVNKQK